MPITTAMADSFKVELLQGAHCFNAVVNPTATISSAGTSATAVSSMAGVAVGMAVTCATAGLAAGTTVSAITSGTTFSFAPVSTATITTTAITITGDVFKMALVKSTPAGTYTNTNSTNYSVLTGSTDEVSGVGYTVAGTTLVNYTSVASGSPVQAVVTFSNASWTTATFSTIGCMIYNTTDRMAGVTGRACGVFDFGGTQTVSNGTFTVVMPGASSGFAILRVA